MYTGMVYTSFCIVFNITPHKNPMLEYQAKSGIEYFSMINKILVTLFLLCLSLSLQAQTVETDFTALYISEGDMVLHSGIHFAPFDAARIIRHDMVHLKDGREYHYSFTGVSLVNTYYALRMYNLDLPASNTTLFSNDISVNSLSLPVFAFELCYPFSRTSVRIGAFQGDLPRMTGKFNGQNGSMGNWNLKGIYTGLTLGDFSCSAYWAGTESDVYTTLWKLGEFDSCLAFLVMRWRNFGFFGTSIQGDTALQGNSLISFFSGQEFSAAGTLNLNAVGGWGTMEVSSGSLTGSCFFLVACVWTKDTGFEYSGQWKDSGLIQQDFRSVTAEWSPATFLVIAPAVSYKMNQTVSIKISRVIPLAFGWDYLFKKESDGHIDSDYASSGTDFSLNAQTLFLSGLTASVRIIFK